MLGVRKIQPSIKIYYSRDSLCLRFGLIVKNRDSPKLVTFCTQIWSRPLIISITIFKKLITLHNRLIWIFVFRTFHTRVIRLYCNIILKPADVKHKQNFIHHSKQSKASTTPSCFCKLDDDNSHFFWPPLDKIKST